MVTKFIPNPITEIYAASTHIYAAITPIYADKFFPNFSKHIETV